MSTRTRRIVALLLAHLAFTGLALAGDSQPESCGTYLKQPPPKYKLARRILTVNAAATALHVSVSPKDATREKLMTLGCNMGLSHARDQVFLVWIFDNHRAAKFFEFSQGSANGREVLRHVRATYFFSREDNTQTFTLENYSGPGRYGTIKTDLGLPPPLPSP